jgi:hypothetical protein
MVRENKNKKCKVVGVAVLRQRRRSKTDHLPRVFLGAVSKILQRQVANWLTRPILILRRMLQPWHKDLSLRVI